VSKVIVIQFMSLDGVIQDPDGSDGTAQAGWAFRYGPEPVSGDPFRLMEVLDAGILLLGRRTWEQFSKIWPGRDDPFSVKMNAIEKLVVSRSLPDAGGWENSTLLQGDLETAVREREQEIVVMGSISVTRALIAADLVDEYRLMVFPLVLGEGTRLFPDGSAPASLASLSAQPVGPAVRLTYARQRGE
jgi:dihydrofolate reductase